MFYVQFGNLKRSGPELAAAARRTMILPLIGPLFDILTQKAWVACLRFVCI